MQCGYLRWNHFLSGSDAERCAYRMFVILLLSLRCTPVRNPPCVLRVCAHQPLLPTGNATVTVHIIREAYRRARSPGRLTEGAGFVIIPLIAGEYLGTLGEEAQTLFPSFGDRARISGWHEHGLLSARLADSGRFQPHLDRHILLGICYFTEVRLAICYRPQGPPVDNMGTHRSILTYAKRL